MCDSKDSCMCVSSSVDFLYCKLISFTFTLNRMQLVWVLVTVNLCQGEYNQTNSCTVVNNRNSAGFGSMSQRFPLIFKSTPDVILNNTIDLKDFIL